jgi:hypothetical protein
MGTHASKKSRKTVARSGRIRAGGKVAKPRTTAKRYSVVMLKGIFSPDGSVNVERFAEELRMSKARLAETLGIALATLQRKARAAAPKTQTRLREGLEIINRVSAWAGGPLQAMAWYRAEPIPAFGGRTAESLVKDGKADAVRDYLDSVALGGFA